MDKTEKAMCLIWVNNQRDGVLFLFADNEIRIDDKKTPKGWSVKETTQIGISISR